jgi:hypothetical protein
MSPFDLLEDSLLDLLDELHNTEVRPILGGGYGLYLKQRFLHETGARALLGSIPEARSTNDLDLFLRTEVVADAHQFRQVAEALERLGCRPIESLKYLQFIRDVFAAGERREVKFDILTGPPHPGVDTRRIRTDPVRWRPRSPGIALHARPTPEAVAIEEHLIEIPLRRRPATVEPYQTVVLLPQPFSYALMKLFALRDRMDDAYKDFGRHHALDLYRIIAMATEAEWTTAMRLSQTHCQDPVVREAGTVVRQCFSGPETLGTLRLREHPQFSSTLELDGFILALAALFPSS